MDLELTAREAAVGSFSLDLLARDLGSDRVVIIENQLGATDHDHLGKLLTYAAGHEASVAVWIAASFREEHRQTLDWLNSRTDSSTAFFGIVIEALQIDNSRPAPNFRLVAFPNEWAKVARLRGGAGSTAKVSGKGEAYLAFFQDLIDRLRTQHSFTNAKKARPQGWYCFASGVSGITYCAGFAEGNALKAEVSIERGDQADTKAVFDMLYQQHALVDAAFGEPLEWERLDSRRRSRIAVYRPGRIEDDDQTLEANKVWLIETLLRLKKVFGPMLPQAASALPGQFIALPPDTET